MQSRRINQGNAHALKLNILMDGVTGCTRDRRNDGAIFTTEGIEQTGLARIGLACDHNSQTAGQTQGTVRLFNEHVE